MNENAKRLIAALRSGEYKQVQGALRRNLYTRDHQGFADRHCCLGVASDIAADDSKGHWSQSAAEREGEYAFVDAHDCEWSDTDLIDPVRDHFGFRTRDGAFLYVVAIPRQDGTSVTGTSLMELNDKGATFDEIADVIESEPPGLFVDSHGAASFRQ